MKGISTRGPATGNEDAWTDKHEENFIPCSTFRRTAIFRLRWKFHASSPREQREKKRAEREKKRE